MSVGESGESVVSKTETVFEYGIKNGINMGLEVPTMSDKLSKTRSKINRKNESQQHER